jgi:hypothetical protein
MSVIGELRVSLDAIGLEQQAFLFLFLTSYPLALGELLRHRGKQVARTAALLAACGFAAFTDPWIHGVLLAIMFVAGMGLFIVAVYLIDVLRQVMVHRFEPPVPRPFQPTLPMPDGQGDAVPEVVRATQPRRPQLSLPGTAGTQ